MLSEPFYHCSGDHMQRQVVGAAGFGVRAAHAESPEGLDADEGACDAAVEVDVAGLELPACALEVVAVLGVDPAREAVGAVVGNAEGLVEVAGLYDGEDGAEDLLARNPGLSLYLEDGRADEVAVVGISRVFAEHAIAFLLSHVHVTRHLLELRLAYDGSKVHVGALRATDFESFGLLDDLIQNLLVDVGMQDGAARGAALLSRVAVSALDDVRGGGVEIRRVIYYHRVLAAHLGYYPLDPALVLYLSGRQLVDAEPRLHRAGKGDKARPCILYQIVPNLRAVARQEVQDAFGQTRLLEYFGHHGADDASELRGLHDDGVPRDDGSARHPREDGGREVPGSDDDPDAHRLVGVAALLAGDGVDLDPVLEPQHLASVILEEIYGLRHLRVGLEPGLAAFVGFPGEQLELAPLHYRRCPEQYARPCLRRGAAPGLESGGRSLQGHIRLALGCAGRAAHHLRGIGRIHRHYLVVRLDAPAADDRGVAPAQPGANVFQGGPHSFDVLLLGPVEVLFVLVRYQSHVRLLSLHPSGYAPHHVSGDVAGDLGVLLEAPGRVLVPVLPEGHVNPELVPGPDQYAP